MTNNEKLEQGLLLPVMETFYSIQGEGFHSGKAAYFLRIGGCDVGCHWCDVKESWDASKHPAIPTDSILENLIKKAETVVVTGGEPLQWKMDYLTQNLKKSNIKTHLETSGAYPLTGEWDWICLSPKKVKLPLSNIYSHADELKVIIKNKYDLKFAEKQALLVDNKCELYLQPEWSVKEKIIPILTNYIMDNPKWKISIQMHKYLSIP